MIDIALMRSELLACVLAVATVPLPNSLGRELGPALRHLVVTGQNQNSRDPNQAADCSDCVIFFPNRKTDPILPSNRAHVAGAKHVEGSRVAVCHHAKGLRRRLHIDRLPISIQYENRCFVQDVIHTVFYVASWRKTVEQMPQKSQVVQHRKQSFMFPICDYHTHPQGHSVRPYTIELLQPWINQCRLKGIQSIAFTDHDRYIDGVDLGVIDRLREQNPDIEILAGIELDNDPLTSTRGVRWVEKNWERLDFVLGSVHYFSGETEMLDRAGEPGQIEARGVSEAFDQYVRALENLVSRGHIDCLAHLDLVKIHGLSPDGYDPVARFGPILEIAREAGLAIEASTAGWRKAVHEQYPHSSILRAAVELQIPITTASDAHSHAQVAAEYEKLAVVLDAAGVTENVTFQRHNPTRKIHRPGSRDEK